LTSNEETCEKNATNTPGQQALHRLRVAASAEQDRFHKDRNREAVNEYGMTMFFTQPA